MVHVVLLGEVEAEPLDPIGIAVYTDRKAAERRAADELRRTGGSGYHAVSLPVGWRADV